MTDVLYPLSFKSDFSYLGMSKRKADEIDNLLQDDPAAAWGILDERYVFKSDYLDIPRTSHGFPIDLGITFTDDTDLYHSFSGISTGISAATIPAVYAEQTDNTQWVGDAQGLQTYDPHRHRTYSVDTSPYLLNTTGSVPMIQPPLPQESLSYYSTPISASTMEPVMTGTTRRASFSSTFDLSGATSSSIPQALQPVDIKPSSDLALALQRTASTENTSRSKRQFTTSEDAIYTCQEPNCGKHFKRIWNYKAHLETHNPNRPKPYICMDQTCGKTFVRRTDLVRHMTCVHSRQKTFRCTLCNSMFARKDTLRRHEDDGCSKRNGIIKAKPKKRTPVIPNREPNPTPKHPASSSKSNPRKSSKTSHDSHAGGSRSTYKQEQR